MATKKKAVKRTGFGKKSPAKKAGAGPRREGVWRSAGKAAPARKKASGSAAKAASRPARAAKPARGKGPARGERKPARGKGPARGEQKPARGGRPARATEPVREVRPARARKPARAPSAIAPPPMPADVAAALAEAPGPGGAAAAAVAEADTARPTALAIARAALDKKAEDVTVLDVRGLTSYADYFVLVTADSDRQAGAIADHVEQEMKAQGVTKVGVEGYQGGRWILVDYGDVVAHVMNKESRGFYDLEGLWADAPRFRVDG